MKKVLAVVLALVFVLSMTACGSKDTLEGSWKITKFTMGGQDVLNQNGFDLAAKLSEKGVYMGIQAKSDKSVRMVAGENEQTLTWNDKTITDGKDEIEYKINGDVLTLTGSQEGTEMYMELKKMTSDEASKFSSQTAEDMNNALIEVAREYAASMMGGSEEE